MKFKHTKCRQHRFACRNELIKLHQNLFFNFPMCAWIKKVNSPVKNNFTAASLKIAHRHKARSAARATLVTIFCAHRWFPCGTMHSVANEISNTVVREGIIRWCSVTHPLDCTFYNIQKLNRRLCIGFDCAERWWQQHLARAKVSRLEILCVPSLSLTEAPRAHTKRK